MKRLSCLLILLLAALTAHAEFYNIYRSNFFCLNEKAGQKATKLPRLHDRHLGIEISWNEAINKSVVFELSPDYKISPFTELRMQVIYFVPQNSTVNSIQLRFRDEHGENFAYSKQITDTSRGKHILDFVIHPDTKPDSVWGGNGNKKIDGTLRFLGMAVGTTDDKTPDKIFFRGVGIEADYIPNPKEQLKTLTVNLAERNPVLRLPNDKRPVELHIRNGSNADASFKATVYLRDVFGTKTKTLEKNCTLPCFETQVLSLPVPKRQGPYYIDVDLTNDSGETRTITTTFGVMEPYGVHTELDTGFQLSICVQLSTLEPENRDYALYLCSLIGCNSMRDGTNWYDSEPEMGKVSYKKTDSVIQSSIQYGIIPELIVFFGGSWATKPTWQCYHKMSSPNLGGSMGLPLPEDKYFSRHIREFCRRYHNVPIFYEIWNEPELPYFANFSPEEYVGLVKIAYEQIKKYAPNCKVMSAGFATPGGTGGHVDKILELGHPYMDIIAIHGHGRFEDFAGYITALKGLMHSHNFTKPWWANESAESSVDVGEYNQALTLVKKAVYTMGEGGMGYTWYCLRNQNRNNDDPMDPENRFGMLNYDYSPRPNFLTFNTVTKQLRGGTFVKKCLPDFNAICAYQFKAPRGNQLVLWHSPDKITGLFWVKAQRPEIIDVFGNATPMPLSNGYGWLTTTGTPIFVQDKLAMPELICPVVDVKGELPLPGKDGNMTLVIANPTNDTIDLEIELSSRNPVLKGETKMKVTIPKGGKEFTLPVHTNMAFTGTPELNIDLKTADGSLQRTIILPINTTFPVKVNAPVEEQPSMVIDSRDQIIFRLPNAPTNIPFYWKGPQDLSASIQWGATEKDLIFRAVITDDVHDQPYKGWPAWKGDNIQIMLRMNNQSQDWELGFSLTKDGPDIFGYSVVGNRTSEECTKLMKLEVKRDETAKTTTYLGAIPWDVLGQKEIPQFFHFNMIVNDSDANVHESQGTLAASPKLLQHYKKVAFVK